jgi:hypothetical protein
MITCPEESYRLWFLVVYDIETWGLLRQKQTNKQTRHLLNDTLSNTESNDRMFSEK